MKTECENYANRLKTIGELIIAASALIKQVDQLKEFTLADYKAYEKNIAEAIESYEYARDSLSEVKTPFVIQNQHRKLVETMGAYIDSINTLRSSVTVTPEKAEINKSQYHNGLTTQQECVNAMGNIIKVIENKLVAYC